MKMKDLKPGMAVAQRASSYNLTEEPVRLIVLSTEHLPGTRWQRMSEVEPFVFSVTADDDGAKYRVKERAFTPGAGEKASVLVLNTINRKTEWLTPGQIEGPYAEVRDERAERRAANEKAKADRDARRQKEIERLRAVKEGLDDLGFPVTVTDSVYGYETEVTLRLEHAEALLMRLAALDDLARRMDEEV